MYVLLLPLPHPFTYNSIVNNLYDMKKIIVWENIISSMNFMFRISQLSYWKQIHQRSASNIFPCNWHNQTGISASLKFSVNHYTILLLHKYITQAQHFRHTKLFPTRELKIWCVKLPQIIRKLYCFGKVITSILLNKLLQKHTWTLWQHQPTSLGGGEWEWVHSAWTKCQRKMFARAQMLLFLCQLKL